MKEIKAYAVVWGKEGVKKYEAKENDIIPVEPAPYEGKKYLVYYDEKAIKLRKKSQKGKYYFIDALAIFAKRKEAKAYRDGNKDFKVVAVEIKLTLKGE